MALVKIKPIGTNDPSLWKDTGDWAAKEENQKQLRNTGYELVDASQLQPSPQATIPNVGGAIKDRIKKNVAVNDLNEPQIARDEKEFVLTNPLDEPELAETDNQADTADENENAEAQAETSNETEDLAVNEPVEEKPKEKAKGKPGRKPGAKKAEKV